MSWEMSRIARMGFSSVMSRSTTDGSSSMRNMHAAEPTFTNVVYSLMLLSPTMTCSRRYFSASACGSSRVLMMGRLRVVALLTPSQMCSARCAIENVAPRAVCSTLPEPVKIWRLTKNGINTSA